jgi:hypothetical protein
MATSFLESLAQTITPDAIGKLSQAVGLDTSQSHKALEVAGPLLLGSRAEKCDLERLGLCSLRSRRRYSV